MSCWSYVSEANMLLNAQVEKERQGSKEWEEQARWETQGFTVSQNVHKNQGYQSVTAHTQEFVKVLVVAKSYFSSLADFIFEEEALASIEILKRKLRTFTGRVGPKEKPIQRMGRANNK